MHVFSKPIVIARIRSGVEDFDMEDLSAFDHDPTLSLKTIIIGL